MGFFQFVGFALTLTGIIGTSYSRRFLGKFWTAETSLKENQAIVSNGPYRFVRHPLYTYAILTYLGAGLVFSAWWNLILSIAISILYIIKTWDEDNYLLKHLPGYAEYAQKVRYRLASGVW